MPKTKRAKISGTARAAGLLTAALAALVAIAAVASAAVTVYSNNFSNASKYREIDPAGKNRKSCDDSWSSNSKVMRVEVSKDTFCEYSPPLTGDADQPDHEITANARILKGTPKSVRRQSYIGVRVRVGDNTYYELRITPKGKKYRLTRNPAGGGSGLPIAGESSEINSLGSKNKIRLRIVDGKVNAIVNGKSIATYIDPNPGQVTGRKVSFGVGSTKNKKAGPVGVFKQIRVAVPNP